VIGATVKPNKQRVQAFAAPPGRNFVTLDRRELVTLSKPSLDEPTMEAGDTARVIG
jgi:hypothetical protein